LNAGNRGQSAGFHSGSWGFFTLRCTSAQPRFNAYRLVKLRKHGWAIPLSAVGIPYTFVWGQPAFTYFLEAIRDVARKLRRYDYDQTTPTYGRVANMLTAKSLSILAGAALAVSVLAAPASADIISLGPASPIDSTITGIGMISFTPTPATEILQVTDPQYSANFPNQNPSTVLDGVANVFGVPAADLTLTDNFETIGATFDETGLTAYNYAAIHNDTGELIFAYSDSRD
jgi:hypothetical protein